MKNLRAVLCLSVCLSVILALPGPAAATPPQFTSSLFATGAAISATAPIGVTSDGTNIWVSYTNGASATGAGGTSTIVEYSPAGAVLNVYAVPGAVEGLKWWSSQGEIWALQNPGGNPTVTVIKPGVGITPTSPLLFAVNSTTRGYADALFLGTSAYLSYTDPVKLIDATIQKVTSSKSPLSVSTVLQKDATGTNLANGETGKPTKQSDPHSLREDLTGGIMMSSAANGQIIFVDSPGAGQTVSFLNVINAVGANVSGLNDLVYTDATSGTFYVADTLNNDVVAIQAKGLTVNTLFGTVGSLFAFAEINTATGVASAIITSFRYPAGLTFVGE